MTTKDKTPEEIIKIINIVCKDNDFYQSYNEFIECTDDNECLFSMIDIKKAVEEGIKEGQRQENKRIKKILPKNWWNTYKQLELQSQNSPMTPHADTEVLSDARRKRSLSSDTSNSQSQDNSHLNKETLEIAKSVETPKVDDTSNSQICKNCGHERKWHKDVFPNLDYFVLNCKKFEPKSQEISEGKD